MNMLTLILTITLIAGTAGCGQNSTTAAEPSISAAEEPESEEKSETELTTEGQHYVFATQSVDSASYSRVAGIIEVLGSGSLGSNTIEIQPISSGGAAGALLLEENQSNFAIGSNIPGKKLSEGTYEEGRAPIQNVASVVGGVDITWGTVFFSDAFVQKTGYTTLEEVFENEYPVRIVTKQPGSFGMDGAIDLLDCFGLTWDDIDSWGGSSYHIAPQQMADMLKEGSADISIDVISIGQPAFTELCLTTPMHVVQLSDEIRAKMNEKGYNSMTMPADSWNGQTEPIETVCGSETILVRKDMPDDVVYAFTKGLFEQKEELVKLVPSLESLDPTVGWQLELTGIELHPGAEAYYREAGYLD